jgi:uncharacterized membrane protein YbjE (DUF340 family)
MFLWFRKLFLAQIKLNLALCASPFDRIRKSPFLIPLQQSSKTAQKAYNVVSYIIFLYVGVTVWNQLHFNFTSTEQFMLSLTFTVVIVAFGMYKLILFRRSNEIIQLLNTLILFETKNFGNKNNY